MSFASDMCLCAGQPEATALPWFTVRSKNTTKSLAERMLKYFSNKTAMVWCCRRDRARDTKERLDKAAKVKAEEEAAAAKMRHVKTEYK